MEEQWLRWLALALGGRLVDDPHPRLVLAMVAVGALAAAAVAASRVAARSPVLTFAVSTGRRC